VREYAERAVARADGPRVPDTPERTRLERERRVIVGNVRKPADRLREEVVRSPKLQKVIHDMAGEGEAERRVLTERALAMVREMEAAIAIFEPRLKRAKVKMEPIEGNSRSVQFVIEGMLCMDPAPEPVRFDTVLELGKCEYEVKGGDGAR